MPEQFTERPVTVAFDGLHRTGKGTQARALVDTLSKNNINSLIVRGDGTRDGLGLSAGDPFSIEWQQRSQYIKSKNGGSIEDWNASSLILQKELSETLKNGNANGIEAVIIDRSILSRAAFLLHRGVGMPGGRMSLDELYPGNKELQAGDQLNLEELVPDVIFDLRVKKPSSLLERLDRDDPKYLFRSRNIKGGFDASVKASSHIPEYIENKVNIIDATDSPENIHQKILYHLGATAVRDTLGF